MIQAIAMIQAMSSFHSSIRVGLTSQEAGNVN